MKFNERGFTLTEMMVVIGVFVVLMTLVLSFFLVAGDQKALENDVAGLKAFLRDARSLSVNSKDAEVFGIHLETGKAVLFEGSSYVPGGPNEKTLEYSRRIYMSGASLNGGGSDVIFTRLYGYTTQYGTITLSTKDDEASTTITILTTGVVQ